jgi:NSS family neurotransmitter:Na+ symporter
MVRETWATRAAFVLAAIGSAVGLGNLWGFPYKLYTYGGGAFLIPYFAAMLIMGIPLLIMEFSVGHWAQQAPPGAFSTVLKKYRYVGWWLVALAFVIITYYSVILAYCVDYLIASLAGFGSQVAWAGENSGGAKEFFFKGLLGYEDTMKLGMPAPRVVAGTLIAWIIVYLCLFRGVKWVSKVVLLTVPLPWIMLVILTARGLTLEGAVQGLEFYLEPRWEKLLQPDTWRFAFGQVFFSMSLGFAVMLSYASFLHRSSDINNNALIIGLGDMGTSFVAGVAVFSMLGGMSLASGTPVPDLVPEGTVGLSFVVFPYGLAQLPATAFFSSVFFLALLTLGIDSAFSIVEACLASVCDSKPEWPRKYVLPGICVVGCGLGLVFTATRGGLNWLGLADALINGPFGILIVALAECLVVGWAWHGKFVKEMRRHANERSDWKLYPWWDVIVKYVAPAFLGILIVWSISGEVHDVIDKWKQTGEFEFPVGLVVGSLVFVAVPVACRLLSGIKEKSQYSDEEKHKGARYGVIYAGTVMIVAAVVIELGHYFGWLGKKEVAFNPNGDLDSTAYMLLTVAMVVIFGGLVWCFWRAMAASDTREVR